MSPILQLFLGLIFLALCCFVTYKITVFLGEKLINRIVASPIFGFWFALVLVAFFALVDVLMLLDVLAGEAPDEYRWQLVLMFGCAALMLVLAILSLRRPRK